MMNLIKELRERSGAGILDCQKALKENNNDIEASLVWLREKGISKAAKKAQRIAAEGLCSIYQEGNKAIICEINSETDFVAKTERFITLINDIAKATLKSNTSTVEEANKFEYEKGKTISEIIVDNTAIIGEKLSFRRFEVQEKNSNDVFGTYLHMGGKIGVITVLENTSNEAVAKDIAMQIAATNPTYINEKDIPEEEIKKETSIQLETIKNDESLKGKPEKVINGILMGRINKWKKEICLVTQQFVKDSSISVGKYLSDNKTNIKSYSHYIVGEGLEKRVENFADEVYGQVNK